MSMLEDNDRTPTPAQLRGAVSAHGSNSGNPASSTTPASVKRRQPAPQGPSKKKASEESVLYESLAASLKQMSSKCTRDHIDTNDPSTVIALGIRDKLRELSNDDRAAAELKINTLLYNMKYGNKQA